MKIIIFDFEVFKYDTLLGCKIVNNDGSLDIFQTWNIEEIKAKKRQVIKRIKNCTNPKEKEIHFR